MALQTPSDLQIYRGYEEGDLDVLRRYATHAAEVNEDHYVDGFGQRTPFASVPFCRSFDATRLAFPVPDDGFHAEALEYIAVADAVSSSPGPDFCAVELGAGWGPWISLAGVLARRQGFHRLHLVGVEAHAARFALLKGQLAFNGLRPDSDVCDTDLAAVHCRLIQGAVGMRGGWLHFPDVPLTDMGPAASEADTPTDYRGQAVRNIRVRAYPLAEVLEGLRRVDFLHIDIQGTEYDVIAANVRLVSRVVDAMLIGTHSRAIEGRLVDLLYKSGWYLHREKPCRVNWAMNAPLLEGMTTQDGIQYWRRT